MEYSEKDFKELVRLGIKWILYENMFIHSEIYIDISYTGGIMSPKQFKGYTIFIKDANGNSKCFSETSTKWLFKKITTHYHNENKISKEEMIQLKANDIQNLYLDKLTKMEQQATKYNW